MHRNLSGVLARRLGTIASALLLVCLAAPARAQAPVDFKPIVCTFALPRGSQLPSDLVSGSQFCPKGYAGHVIAPDDGEVAVVVKAADFEEAKNGKPAGAPWLLLVDGASVGSNAVLTRAVTGVSEVLLRFPLTSASDGGAFWTAAYQATGFEPARRVYVEVGWQSAPGVYREFFRPSGNSMDSLVIATEWSLATAGVCILVVIGAFAWAMWGSDLFRIGARPAGAQQRLAFSFARVQWGVWVCFSLMAALFLWSIYGNFPRLSTTLLALTAVSTVTATTSFFMDSVTPTAPSFSRSLWSDLLSGNNDVMQAHRFQALLVNILLLVGTAFWVKRHLTFPDFDASWLQMLGLSDAAALAGKHLLENQPVAAVALNPAGAGAPNAGPGGAPGAGAGGAGPAGPAGGGAAVLVAADNKAQRDIAATAVQEAASVVGRAKAAAGKSDVSGDSAAALQSDVSGSTSKDADPDGGTAQGSAPAAS